MFASNRFSYKSMVALMSMAFSARHGRVSANIRSGSLWCVSGPTPSPLNVCSAKSQAYRRDQLVLVPSHIQGSRWGAFGDEVAQAPFQRRMRHDNLKS